MPLKRGYSGKPRKQAIAIALNVARKARRRKRR